MIFSPNGKAIFSSVARVGLPEPFSNPESMRGEMSATFWAYFHGTIHFCEFFLSLFAGFYVFLGWDKLGCEMI